MNSSTDIAAECLERSRESKICNYNWRRQVFSTERDSDGEGVGDGDVQVVDDSDWNSTGCGINSNIAGGEEEISLRVHDNIQLRVSNILHSNENLTDTKS